MIAIRFSSVPDIANPDDNLLRLGGERFETSAATDMLKGLAFGRFRPLNLVQQEAEKLEQVQALRL